MKRQPLRNSSILVKSVYPLTNNGTLPNKRSAKGGPYQFRRDGNEGLLNPNNGRSVSLHPNRGSHHVNHENGRRTPNERQTFKPRRTTMLHTYYSTNYPSIPNNLRNVQVNHVRTRIDPLRRNNRLLQNRPPTISNSTKPFTLFLNPRQNNRTSRCLNPRYNRLL